MKRKRIKKVECKYPPSTLIRFWWCPFLLDLSSSRDQIMLIFVLCGVVNKIFGGLCDAKT